MRLFLLRLILPQVLAAICAPAWSHTGSTGSGLASNVGQIAFENSGARAAQADFLRGLALLHNFEYREAAAAFQRAEAKDPGFAMAYWGEAMSHNHAVWFEQELTQARAALAKLGATPEARQGKAKTEREKAYLSAAEMLFGEGSKHDRDRRYALAMETLAHRWPEDVDAQCFYALALLGTSDSGREQSTYMKAAALMQDAFQKYPLHPGAAHYLIHSVDDGVHAPLGLRAARAYARIAPKSGHAQHMASHIYLALGLWADTRDANLQSIDVDLEALRRRDPQTQPWGCGHAELFLQYAYTELGNWPKSEAMIAACAQDHEKHPYVDEGKGALEADGSTAVCFSAMRTRHLIESQDWTGPIARWAKPAVINLPAFDFSWAVAESLGAIRRGELSDAQPILESARQAAKKLLASMDRFEIPQDHPSRQVPGITLDELSGLLKIKQGQVLDGLALLQGAARSESALKTDFGPPSVEIPANELLGEQLLLLHRIAEARVAFEAADIVGPGRTAVLRGLITCAEASGDASSAQALKARLQASSERTLVTR